MSQRIEKPFDETQQYLSDHAHLFIAYIAQRAAQCNELSELFDENNDRFLLSDDQSDLKTILSDEIFQKKVDLRISAWKPHYSRDSIAITRSQIRDYYFEPLRRHPKWQEFLNEHPDTPQPLLNQIAGAFSYWIALIWLSKHPEGRLKMQPLIKILDSDKTSEDMCNEFKTILIKKLQEQLSNVFMSIYDGDVEEGKIQKTILDALISIHHSEDLQVHPNGKNIFWSRILNFLGNKMIVQAMVIPKKESDEEKQEQELTKDKEFDKKTKSKIAKGILDYLKTIPKDELTNEKNFITLSSIIGEAHPHASKNNKDYKELFVFLSRQKEKISIKEKRDAYSNHPLSFAKTLSVFGYKPKQVAEQKPEKPDAKLITMRRISTKRASSSTHSRIPSSFLSEPNLKPLESVSAATSPRLDDDANVIIQPISATPRQ